MQRFELSTGWIAAAVALAGPVVNAQPAVDTRAQAVYDQIDRIFQKKEFDPPRFGPARWMPDGTSYAIVEPAPPPSTGREIVRYDAASGARSILVSASRLVPAGATAPLDVSDYVPAAFLSPGGFCSCDFGQDVSCAMVAAMNVRPRFAYDGGSQHGEGAVWRSTRTQPGVRRSSHLRDVLRYGALGQAWWWLAEPAP